MRNDAGEALLERADGAPLVLGVGEVLPFSPTRRARRVAAGRRRAHDRGGARGRCRSTSSTCTSRSRPSASSVALRHSRALNVGSFHAPDRADPLDAARPARCRSCCSARLDARTASYGATRDLLQRYFPGDYRVIPPGAEPQPLARATAQDPSAAGIDRRRGARGAAHLPARAAGAAGRARLARDRLVAAAAGARRRRSAGCCATGSTFVDAGPAAERRCCARPDVARARLRGHPRDPGQRSCGRSPAASCPVASRLPVYEELLGRRRARARVRARRRARRSSGSPRAADRRAGAPLARARAGRGSCAVKFGWSRGRRRARGRSTRGSSPGATTARRRPQVRARLAARPLIDVDLHMHTDHSYDCATPVEVLLAEARARGLGAIAVTDHNEISGRARGPRQGRRDRGDRRRGGQDRRAGRGDRPVHRGEDPARDDAPGDDRRDQAPGRARVRAAPVRPAALGPRLRAPARGARRRRRDRGLQPADRDHASSTRRRSGSPPSTGSRPAPGPTPTCPRGSARCGSGCATSTAPKSSWSRCATPTSSATRPACCTSRRSSSCRPRRCRSRRAGPRASAACAAPRAAMRDERPAPQVLMHSQGQAREPSNPDSDAGYRRRDPREVPRARDPRAERFRARAPVVPPLPARRADARARAPATRRPTSSWSSTPRGPRRSRRASRSTGAPATR